MDWFNTEELRQEVGFEIGTEDLSVKLSTDAPYRLDLLNNMRFALQVSVAHSEYDAAFSSLSSCGKHCLDQRRQPFGIAQCWCVRVQRQCRCSAGASGIPVSFVRLNAPIFFGGALCWRSGRL